MSGQVQKAIKMQRSVDHCSPEDNDTALLLSLNHASICFRDLHRVQCEQATPGGQGRQDKLDTFLQAESTKLKALKDRG
jgi:hypothetical protein